jgi:hypothetical protein
MRIYAVADIHGRAERFKLIRTKAIETAADLVVMAGDIAGFMSRRRIPEYLNTIPVPVFYVRGNSDSRHTDRLLNYFPHITHLHEKKVICRGVCFGGISGAFLLPFESRMCLLEKRMTARLDRFLNDVSVLVTHPPPRNTLDRVMGRFPSGSRALRELILRYQPSVLICGHIHENPGLTFLGRTMVVNCSMAGKGAGVIVECPAGGKPQAAMLHD